MRRATIIGTGGYVPDRVVTNDDLIEVYGMQTSDAWIHSRTGIHTRHYAPEGTGPAKLALPAAQAALASAGIEATQLDLIVFCTLSPERAFPGSGVLLQALLGLPEGERFVPALDVRNQCSGFLYGLQVASNAIAAGTARHVLLVGAEVHSAALDLSTQGRSVSPIFGDGAGAVVLRAADEGQEGIVTVQLGADGRYAQALYQDVWNMTQRPFIPTDAHGQGVIPAEQLWAHMDGKLVFHHAVRRMTQCLGTLCADTQTDLDAIDLFAFHQANARINTLVAERLGIASHKLLHNIERYGNTTAATIPLLLDEATRSGRLQPGMLVAAVAFGSGFTWGSTLLQWS